jgi:peptidoglycan hydrolase-like protein with peptidoglycan-binding domain
MARIRQLSLTVLVCLTTAAAGAGLGVVVGHGSAPALLDTAQETRSAPVTVQEFVDERTVPVELVVSDGADLSTAAEGRVTESRATAGTAIESGSLVLRVDETPVVALHTEVPLYRDLGPGDKGRDVEALQSELRRLGYPTGSGTTYGRQTVAAVKALLTAAGVTKPDGRLRLAEVLWIPTASVVPDTWTAGAGVLLDETGTVGTLAGALTAVRMTAPSGLAPGARDLTLFGATATVGDDGTVADPDFLSAVMHDADYVALRDSETPAATTAVIALHEPVSALRVPPSALFAIDGDLACLQVDGTPAAVTVVGSGLGASLVTLDGAGEVPESVDLGSAVTASTCR